METRSDSRPVILEDDDALDLFETFATVKLATAQLRPGMILLDELGTPVAMLDHRIGARSGGIVEWLAHDLERGGFPVVTFPSTRAAAIPVAAR